MLLKEVSLFSLALSLCTSAITVSGKDELICAIDFCLVNNTFLTCIEMLR